jgi:DNA-binding MarR family transcriptional regulator
VFATITLKLYFWYPCVVTEPKWLNSDEMRAWRMFIGTSGDLLRAIERDLAPFRLDLGDYQLLAILSESPEQQLRMCDLAAMLQLSRGGLTRRMEGVLKAKLVSRRQADDDKRVAYAVLTSKGLTLLKKVAPAHLCSVRRMMIDHLTSSEIKAIGSAFAKIADHLGTEVD